mmetsp:Transcript_94334/g.262014  ORF Transcript_94334/g.262014 Transcript_94334/m.262014 type:complete len:211 (+) Transcript_94334:3-635(+)
MDALAASARKWADAAAGMECNSLLGIGADVASKLDNLTSSQRGCLDLQETAATIAPGTIFNGNGVSLGCVKNVEGSCEALNCYRSDAGFRDAAQQLAARNLVCRETADKLVGAGIRGIGEADRRRLSLLMALPGSDFTQAAMPPPSELAAAWALLGPGAASRAGGADVMSGEAPTSGGPARCEARRRGSACRRRAFAMARRRSAARAFLS